jgi:hypothetical protein
VGQRAAAGPVGTAPAGERGVRGGGDPGEGVPAIEPTGAGGHLTGHGGERAP